MDFQLRNGVRMPALGLGTSHSGGYSHDAVVHALRNCGYSLIDTAKRYGNEEKLSFAVQESGRERRELFLTSKLWPTDYGFSSTNAAFYGSMDRLNVDYLDLYLIHWPIFASKTDDRKVVLEETWRCLELLLDQDLCRAIGVSNFAVEDLEELMEIASVVPHVNQSEFHVHHNAAFLREFCMENRIQFEGHCPLGKGSLLSIPLVVDLANKYKKTPAQLLLRWSVQHEVVTIPKSVHIQRVSENIQIFDFEISDCDMEMLNGLNMDRSLIDKNAVQERLKMNLPDGYKLSFCS